MKSYLCLEELYIQVFLKLAEGSSDIGLGHAEGCCCLVQCLRHCQRSQHNELLQREGKGEVCCSSVTTKCSGTLYRVRCVQFDAGPSRCMTNRAILSPSVTMPSGSATNP